MDMYMPCTAREEFNMLRCWTFGYGRVPFRPSPLQLYDDDLSDPHQPTPALPRYRWERGWCDYLMCSSPHTSLVSRQVLMGHKNLSRNSEFILKFGKATVDTIYQYHMYLQPVFICFARWSEFTVRYTDLSWYSVAALGACAVRHAIRHLDGVS